MPGLASPDIQVAQARKEASSPVIESKTVGQKAKEMVQRIRDKIRRPNPNPDEALAEITTFPNTEERNVLASPQTPDSSSSSQVNEPTKVAAPGSTTPESGELATLALADKQQVQQSSPEPESKPEILVDIQGEIDKLPDEKRQLLEQIRQESPATLERVLDRVCREYEDKRKVRVEGEKIEDTFQVSINIPPENLEALLASGQYKTAHEVTPLVNQKLGSFGWTAEDALAEQTRVEERLGFKAEGTADDPYPIYGAAYSVNGIDERAGAAPRYGDSFILLKNAHIRDRTTFSLGDSFSEDWGSLRVMWGEAPYLKAITQIISGHVDSGVEAIILGGVSIQDIESINIPKEVLDNNPEKGKIILSNIERFRQEHPDITFNIVG